MTDTVESMIDHIFSWPVAALIICLAFWKPLFALLTEATALLKRSTKLSLKHGDTTVEAGSDVLPRQREEKVNDAALGSNVTIAQADAEIGETELELARQSLRDYAKGLITVGMRQNNIREELRRLEYVVPKDDLTNILIRQVAGAQSTAAFEKIYRLIFGSQLQVLDGLNRNGPQPFSFLRLFYDLAKTENPEIYKDRTDLQWFAFLVSEGLVTQDGEEKKENLSDQNFALSHLGRDFLLWIVYEGLTLRKAY